MRVYADSSFILRLVTAEHGSEQAMAEYRRLEHPTLFYLPLHDLEVRNAILQRAFHQRHSSGAGERRQINRERDAAFGRLQHYIKRRALLEVAIDADGAFASAAKLSTTHTQRLGARAIDLLHVASAMALESEVFLTADLRQAQIAKAEGLKLASVLLD